MLRERNLRDARRSQIIEAWKATVEVQKHFNDISMRIRSMFVTVILGLFASIGFLIDKHIGLHISNINIQFTTVLPIFGIVGTYLFYFIDRYWYHRLLLGSVLHAISIEKRYGRELPELSLSIRIGEESPYAPQGTVTRFLAKLLVDDPRYRGTGKLHSDAKIEIFYKSVVVVLIGTTIMLAVLGGITTDGNAPIASHQSGMPSVTRTAPVSPSLQAPSPLLAAPPSVAAPPSPASEPLSVPPPGTKAK